MSRSPILTRALAVVALVAAGITLSGCSAIQGLLGNNVFTLEVGNCFNDEDLNGEVANVPIVDCSEPHDNEVYYSHLIADGAYPGLDTVTAEADAVCADQYEVFLGLPYEESTLEVGYFYPTETSWDGGDREILCMIFDPAGQVTGSLAGAAR